MALFISIVALTLGAAVPPFDELVRRSDRVVLAQVMDSRVDIPDGDLKKMVTVTTLLIRENYRGTGPEKVELVQLGGQNGLWERHVHGDAVFELAESAVVFLKCPDQQTPERCSLVGLKAGKLPLQQSREQGQRVLVQVADRSEPHSLEQVVDEVRRLTRAEQRGSADPRPSKGKQ